MSASMYRSQLEMKRRQRMEAQKQANTYRSRETEKRLAATKARADADRASNPGTASSRLRESQRREDEANAAAKDADRYQKKAYDLQREETTIEDRLRKAELDEANKRVAVERKQAEQRAKAHEDQLARAEQQRRQAEHRVTVLTRQLNDRVSETETVVREALRRLPAPRPERLRVLLLGASSDGGLRVGREQKRIRLAVESSLHRDQVELDVRPAATTADLLDGITKFRPHVVHFSGHSDDALIEFEDEKDEPHKGTVVTAQAFASAVAATDQPPLLVLLNSCNSASQINALVRHVVPFAIGMADEIDDGDAINYAAQFYAAVANGQSIQSSHESGRAALELAGLAGKDLPTLAFADDVDPRSTYLVQPPE